MSFGARRGAWRSAGGYGGPMETVRWGVLAPGRIAHSFAADLALVPDGELVATGSRSLERASEFAAAYGGTAHGSYEDLVNDPQVDVVYVASPHALHDEHTRLALEAGKPVLCEKPMTLDADSAALLFEEAAARGLFLMEAMWTACHPTIRKLLALLASGQYGTPRQVHADLGMRGRDRSRRPAPRPRPRGRRPAGHGHLPADPRPPGARRARAAWQRRRTCPRAASTSTSRSPGSTRAVRPRR